VHFTLGKFGANEFAATQGAVRLRGQHPLPTQVGAASQYGWCKVGSCGIAPSASE